LDCTWDGFVGFRENQPFQAVTLGETGYRAAPMLPDAMDQAAVTPTYSIPLGLLIMM
jgi:hypothetical protein